MISRREVVCCNNHCTCHRVLISLHVLDAITFILRFRLVCIDLSKAKQKPANPAYSVIVLLLELVRTLPFFCSNILYCITKCFKNEFFADDENPIFCHRRKALRIVAFTCLPCQCYQDHPQGMQLTRIFILVCCYIFRFIASKLGASCAEVFKSRCASYKLVSRIALVPSFCILIIEWCHFHRLWHYRPNISSGLTERRNRSHLRFIPDKLINDKRTIRFNGSLCIYQDQCSSSSLQHTLLYHSLREDRTPLMNVGTNQIIIAYHVTTTELAAQIAQNGFPVTSRRQVDPKIYFTSAVEERENFGPTDHKAIICVRLSLGDFLKVQNDRELLFDLYDAQPYSPQTLVCRTSGKIKVRFPGQIENWVIVLPTNDEEDFDSSYYDGCV